MSKFCGNCGAQMDDEDRVCGQCGTPFGGISTAPVEKGTDNNTNGSINGVKNNKVLKIVAAGICAIIAIVIISNVAKGFTGYNLTIRRMVHALKNDDVTTLVLLSSSIADNIYGEWYGDEIYEYYDESVSDTLDAYENTVGVIKKIDYEITDETQFSDRKIKDIKDKLADDYNMDTSDIKKIVAVDLKLTVKGQKKSSLFSVNDLYMIKEGGSWRIYYGNYF